MNNAIEIQNETQHRSHVDAYEIFQQYGTEEDQASLSQFEMACENGWICAAEYDPESFDEMVRQDMECHW